MAKLQARHFSAGDRWSSQPLVEAIEAAMRTSEGTTIWYLRVIHHLAQQSDVWTLDISGEEWGEVDFPPDVAAARALCERWDAGSKAPRG